MLVHRPAVYEHAAALIGQPPQRVQGDADLLYAAHRRAAELYRLSHVVVAMDIYGADAAAVAAAVGGPAPESLERLAALDFDNAGFPAGPQLHILAAAVRLAGELADQAQVRIPVAGPFSLAANLLGFEPLLLGLLDSPERLAQALDGLTSAQERTIAACRGSGCGVTIFESAASPPLLDPKDFERWVAPRLARLMAAARDATGRPAELILGGPTGPILPAILKLAPALVICDPANDPATFLVACRAAGVDLRVNLPANMLLPEHRVQAHHRLESLAGLARGSAPLYVATGVIGATAESEHVLAFTQLVELFGDVAG